MLGGFLFFQRTSSSNLGKKLKAVLVLIIHENGLGNRVFNLVFHKNKF